MIKKFELPSALFLHLDVARLIATRLIERLTQKAPLYDHGPVITGRPFTSEELKFLDNEFQRLVEEAALARIWLHKALLLLELQPREVRRGTQDVPKNEMRPRCSFCPLCGDLLLPSPDEKREETFECASHHVWVLEGQRTEAKQEDDA